MARFCLDVRFGKRGGSSTYILRLVPELLKLAPEDEFILVGFPEDWSALPRPVTWLRPPRGNALLQYAWVQSVLPIQLKRRRVDVYHALKHVGPVFGRSLRVQSQHAIGHWCGAYPLPIAESIYWRLLALPSLWRASAVVAVSRFVAEGVVRHARVNPTKVHVIPPGRDPFFDTRESELQENPPGSEPLLLCVGNLLPVKNQEILIRALPYIERPAKLVLAGDSTTGYAAKVRRLVGDLGVENRVRFAGFVDAKTLRSLYHRAHLFLMASLHEGFPIALVEAMSCGVPALLARCGGLAELGHGAAAFVETTASPKVWASAITALLSDDERRAALADAARHRVRSLEWSTAARHVLGVYRELLSVRPR